MRHIERLKQLKHNETYLEIIEDIKKLVINIKYKENNEVQLKLEARVDDEKTIEKICCVLKYYEFSEHLNINSSFELRSFIAKNRYYIGYENQQYVFCKFFMNGVMKKYKKQEIEDMHKVNINAL